MPQLPWRRHLKTFASLSAFVRSYGTPAGRRALRNFIGLVLLQVVSQGCNFGILLLLTHGLTPEQYGSVLFAQSVQSVLQTISASGFAVLVVRDLSRNPESVDSTITAYLSLTGTFAIACGMGSCTWAWTADIPVPERTLFAWCALANVFASISIGPVYDAFHRQALAAALQVPCDLLAVGLLAALVATDQLTLTALGGVLAGRVALQGAVLLGAVRRSATMFRWRFELRQSLAMLRSGLPITLATLLYMIPNAASIAIVRFEHGPAEAAVYGLAAQFAGYFFMVFSLLARILQPHIAGPHGGERSMMWKVGGVGVGFVLLGGLLALGGGYVLFHRVLGPAYASGYELYVWLLLGALLLCATSILAQYQIVAGREWLLFTCYAIATGAFGGFLWLSGTASLSAIALDNVAFSACLLATTVLGLCYARPAAMTDLG